MKVHLPDILLQWARNRINDLYAGGTQPCLLAILPSGTGRDMFHGKVKAVLDAWINAIAAVLVESGLVEILAQQRGEDALIAIQGALMVSQSLDDTAIFQRTIRHLPQVLIRAA